MPKVYLIGVYNKFVSFSLLLKSSHKFAKTIKNLPQAKKIESAEVKSFILKYLTIQSRPKKNISGVWKYFSYQLFVPLTGISVRKWSAQRECNTVCNYSKQNHPFELPVKKIVCVTVIIIEIETKCLTKMKALKKTVYIFNNVCFVY